MGFATLLHFNVSGGEGLDEQLKCWIENKVSIQGLPGKYLRSPDWVWEPSVGLHASHTESSA